MTQPAPDEWYRWLLSTRHANDPVFQEEVMRVVQENQRFKRAVADLTLDKQILKEALDHLENG